MGWINSQTKAILTIHDHVITHNPRVSVTRVRADTYETWSLHIRSVTVEDKGTYECQINTDPMKIQVSVLFFNVKYPLNITNKIKASFSNFKV